MLIRLGREGRIAGRSCRSILYLLRAMARPTDRKPFGRFKRRTVIDRRRGLRAGVAGNLGRIVRGNACGPRFADPACAQIARPNVRTQARQRRLRSGTPHRAGGRWRSDAKGGALSYGRQAYQLFGNDVVNHNSANVCGLERIPLAIKQLLKPLARYGKTRSIKRATLQFRHRLTVF